MQNILSLIRQEIETDPFYSQNFANDGERFVAWYLRRVMLLDGIATKYAITDGKDDKQIDAVIIDDDAQRIVTIQGKFLSAAEVDKSPLLEVLAAWTRLQDLEALQKDCNEKLKVKMEAIRKALEDGYQVEFELLTTGKLTEAAQADFAAYATRFEDSDDLPASLHLVDAEVLETRLAESEAQELPTIDHVISVEPANTLVTTVAGTQTVVTVLPLRECLKLPGITDGRLFRKNVRQSLGGTTK